jgi:hypothetical protein
MKLQCLGPEDWQDHRPRHQRAEGFPDLSLTLSFGDAGFLFITITILRNRESLVS